MTQNPWLMHGCYHCINEGQARDVLLAPINITCKSNGFGTIVEGVCIRNHKFVIQSPSNTSRVYDDPARGFHRRLTSKYIDHDINLLVVLAAYLSGLGGTEVQRIAAALNLKNFNPCLKMYHKSSKHYVSNIVIQEAKIVVKEALVEEVRNGFFQRHPSCDEDDWKSYLHWTSNTSVDDPDQSDDERETFSPVDLVVSADMGWQKRSSGRKYDSPSGHMFLVGSATGKIVAFDLKCVNCATCLRAQKDNKIPRAHHCPKNFDGHAKAMEATTAAELIVHISNQFNGKARVSTVISDDDSSMRSHCSHAGGLPTTIYEPIFLADPSHRCKIIGKPLFKLAALKKSSCTLTTHDATRIKVYTACFFNQNRGKGRTVAWMQEHVWCVLYHYFDDHRFCTSDFCYKIRENCAQSNQNPAEEQAHPLPQSRVPAASHSTLSKLHALRSSPGYYRCMKKDSKLFNQLKDCLMPYFGAEAIKEVMHEHNTQRNEGMNTAMCISAPKFKNFSRSPELSTRVALVAGCQNLGKCKFVERVIEKFNFATKPTAFLSLLEKEDNAKIKRQERQASVRVKRQRITKRVSKALESRQKDIKAAQKGTTYGDDNAVVKKKSNNPSTCPFRQFGCNTPGHTHTTILAKECKYHYLWKQNRDLEKPEKITKDEWFSRVKAVWLEENNEDVSRSQISIRDVILHEFDGDISLLSCSDNEDVHSSSSVALTANLQSSSLHSSNVITQQDDPNSQCNAWSIDMCDMQFTNSNEEVCHNSDDSDAEISNEDQSISSNLYSSYPDDHGLAYITQDTELEVTQDDDSEKKIPASSEITTVEEDTNNFYPIEEGAADATGTSTVGHLKMSRKPLDASINTDDGERSVWL